MKVTRTILIGENVDVSIRKLCTYWENRGMKFIRRSEAYLKGTRGNFLGNLLSFNMKHLICQIEIDKKQDRLECILSVNTILQYITESNYNFFELELETFEKYLLSNDLNQRAWQEQRKKSKQQDISFIFYYFFSTLVTVVVTALLF